MLNLLKQLWRPTIYEVCYVYSFGMDCDKQTGYKYRNLEQAKSKLNELNEMTEEQLKQEGISPPPYYFRILTIISGHPLTRLLNLTGRRRMYKIFGYYI